MIRKLRIPAACAALLLATAACTSGGAKPAAAGPGTPSSSALPPVAQCTKDATAATWPGQLPQPGAMPSGSTMAKIQQRGFLIAGIDLSTWLFGYDPQHTNTPQGFDVDIARQIAKAIFGDDNHIQFKVVTLNDPTTGEVPELNSDGVDVIVRTTTITCRRLEDRNFSNPYYTAAQKVLVPKSLPADTTLADLKGKQVCATQGSTAYGNIVSKIGPASAYPGVTNALDCLMLLQEDKVDAISTDDAILRGMVAQDPQTQITTAASIQDQPYGIVTAKANKDLSQFVNGVLSQIEANGTWAAIYKQDLGENPTTTPQTPNDYPLG
jgi:polar amino acid transport system substrate-binding protein